jgi:Ribosomal protein L9, C-terminal domain
VTPTNIADEIWRTRKVRLDRRKIDLENIKRIGRYDVPIDVFDGVHAEVKTLVVPEGGELPSDEELAAMEASERGTEPEAEAAEAAPAEAEPVAPVEQTPVEETPVEQALAEPEPDWRADAEAALRDQ